MQSLHVLFGSTASIAGALTVLAWRVRESRRPLTARAILLPPLGMSTGLVMFAVPAMRVPWTWGVAAFLAGALLLSVPLVRSSRLERRGAAVMMQRSRIFLAVFVALAGLRFALRDSLDHVVTPLQTGALMYLLALGTIACWRVWMYGAYRRLLAGGRRE